MEAPGKMLILEFKAEEFIVGLLEIYCVLSLGWAGSVIILL